MTPQRYQPARLRSIGLGIAVFVVILLALCSLSQGVKWTGTVLLFIPERLGLVRTVRPGEVLNIAMDRSPTQVTFARAGLYQVYTSDYDLLVISDELARSDSPPWVTITRAEGGTPADITHIKRGLLPFDTPHVAGRPVLEIEILEPGSYILDYPTRGATMSLAPDYATGHEGMIYAAFAVQFLILALPFGLALFRREQHTWELVRAKRRQSVEQFEKLRNLTRGADSGDDLP
jgi:hypothetical protein